MKQLNKGDKVRDNDCIYEVVAVVMSTAYLRAIDCSDRAVCCDLQNDCMDYKIEILN